MINDRISKELENLQGLCFIGNSIADNVVYQLDVKFVMPRTTEIFHHKFSHVFPVLADNITDYASERNVYFHRPVVPENRKEYQNLTTAFGDLFDFMKDFEQAIIDIMDVCIEDNDKMTRKFLDNFLFEVKKYTAMTINACDYVDMNGDTPKDWMDMDARINKFMGIPPEIAVTAAIELDD